MKQLALLYKTLREWFDPAYEGSPYDSEKYRVEAKKFNQVLIKKKVAFR